MTVSDQLQKHYHGEGGIRVLLGIAFPMIVSSAAETVMMFVDRIFLSRLSPTHLSAALGGGLTAFMTFTFFLGVVGYVNALVAQQFGAKTPHKCGRAGAQGLILGAMSYPFILALIPIVGNLFEIVGHEEQQVALEVSYFKILALGSLFGLLRTALSGFFCGIGRTRMVMIANLVAMLVNIPANYVLILGKFGCPSLGIEGAAYGTLLGSLVGLLIMMIGYWTPHMRREFSTASEWRWDTAMMKQLLRFGLPSGVEFFMNVAAFNIFVIVFHSYGPNAAAAITITLNWDLLAFLPLLGLGQAVTSLTGRYLGAGEPDNIRRATYSGIKSCFLYGVLMSALFVCVPGPLVDLFAEGDAYEAIRPMAITLLRLAAIYTVADGILVVFDGALRGVGDTKWTMRTSVTLHWGMTVSCILLIRVLKVDPVQAWGSLILFVLLLTFVLGRRFVSNKWQALDVVGPETTPTTVIDGVSSRFPPDVR